MSDGKVQLEAEFDASGVRRGADEVTGAVRQMGREVEREASRVSAATAKMGGGSEQAAQSAQKAERSIIASIQRQTAAYEAGGRSTREYYEAIARQRGIGADVLKPYLDQLDAAKSKQHEAADGAEKLGSGLVSLRGAAAAAGAAIAAYVTVDAAKAIIDQADAVSLLNSRLRAVVGGADEFAAAQKGLFELAQSNSVGLNETIQLYTRLSDPIKRLGGGMNEVIGVTNAFQKALQLGGVSAQEAASATLQFGQALGAGVLAGDEFKSLAEASPRLLKAIAEGANLPIESLKKLGSEGKLTAEVVSNALLKMGSELDAEFAAMPDTVGKSMTRLQNEVTRAIGEMNENTNLTLGVASMVDEASKLVPIFYNELGGAIQAVGGWLQENKDWIVASIDATKALIADVWNVGKGAMSVAGAFGEWIGKTNVVATAITGIRMLLAGVQDGVKILAGTFSWLGGVIISAVLAPVQAVIRGLSAAASLIGKSEWAASLNSASAAMLNFSTAGIKAGEGIYREFSNGQTALGRLNESLKSTSKSAEAAGTSAMLSGTGFRALKGGVDDAEKSIKRAAGTAKEAKDEFADLLNKLTAKDAGLSPDFYKNLNVLYEGFKKGRIGVDEYRAAVESLIAQQQFAKDIAKQLADEQKRLEDSRKKELDTAIKSVESLKDGNAKLREEIDTMGMSRSEKVAYTQAINQATIAKLEEKLATIELMGGEEELRAEIEKQIAQLEDRNALLGRKDVVEAQLEANKAIIDEAQKTADSINQSLTDALLRGFEGGKGFAKNFKDTLVNMFKTLVLRPVISFIVQPIGNAISGIVSGLLGGGQSGGAGGILGGATNGNSILNFGSLISNWMGAGSGAAAGTLAYGNMIGALGGDGLGAFMAANGGWGTSGAGALASSAAPLAGLAAVAAPLIIGAIAESRTRDRFSGAAFATSNFAKDPTVTIGGAEYDPIKGILPDREALVGRALEAGISQDMIDRFKDKDRALLHYIRMLDSSRQSGNEGPPINVNALLENDNMYAADWYRGQGYAHPQAMGWWNGKGYDLASNDPAITSASRAVATSIVGPLTEINRILGGAADDFRVTAGYATRGAGKGVWAGLNISQGENNLVDWVNKDDFHSPQEAVKGMYEQALGALEKLDLPKWAQKQVDGAQAAMAGIKGDKMGEAAAALYAQTAGSIAQTISAIKMLIDVFPDFSGQTQDTVHAIATSMGGLENLTSGYQSYLQGFYSEEERRALAMKQLSAQFAELGLSLPASRDGFRALVEAQDLSTEAGREMFAALIGLSGAFAEIAATSTAAVDEITANSTAAFADAQALAGVIRDGLLGNIAAEDLGGRMADVVIGGIYNAIAGGFADQITQIMMNGVITPMIQAAVTGSSISGAVSQATIDKMVADATRVAQALGTVLNDPAFRGAMGQIEQMMLNLAPRIPPPTPYYVSSDTRRQEAERIRQEAARARQQAEDEAARRAEQVANERLGLTKQLLQLEGNTVLLRQIELEALDPSNRALQQRIWAIEDETAAAEKYKSALKDAQDFLGGFTKNIEEFISKVSHAQADAQQSYQMAAAKFTAQMTLARGGDRDAMNGITGYADTLIGSIRRESTTGAEANLRIARVLGQLASLPKQVSAEQLIVDAIVNANTSLETVLSTNFASLDANVDGLLTAGELAASGLATNTQISALMARVDANGDGMISKQELANSRLQTLATAQGTTNTNLGNVTSAQNSTNSWLSQIQMADVGYSLSNVNAINAGAGATVAAINKTNADLGVALVRNYAQVPVVAQFRSDSPLFSIFAAINETNAWLYHIHGLETASIRFWQAMLNNSAPVTVRSENRTPANGTVFADGGYTGPGAKWEPAGVVHKGEVVWSQADVARWGGPGIVDALRQGAPGYADGGPVAVRVPQIYVPPVGRSNEETQALLREVLAELRAQRSDDRARHNSLAEPLQRMDRRGAKWDRDGLPAERTNEAIA